VRTRSAEKRMIGGFEVSTTRLHPTRALKLAPKIAKILIPLIRLQNAAALLASDAGQLVAPMTGLIESLDDATLDLLYRELLANTSIIVPDESDRLTSIDLNTPQMIDIAFGGFDNGMSLLLETLVFAGEVNFKRSFFDLIERMGLRKSPATAPAST
jgi:hypothetical protein